MTAIGSLHSWKASAYSPQSHQRVRFNAGDIYLEGTLSHPPSTPLDERWRITHRSVPKLWWGHLGSVDPCWVREGRRHRGRVDRVSGVWGRCSPGV